MPWGKQGGLRKIIRWLWIYFLYFSGSIRRARKRIAAAGGLVVLTFHRVLEDADYAISNSPSGMVVRSTTFHEALDFLRAHYTVLSLDGLPPSWKSTSDPRFVITFDDGWYDTAKIAFPLAQKNALPFTVFICPGLVGKSSPFWPERVIAAWRAAAKSAELSAKFVEICASASLGDLQFPVSAGEDRLDELLVRLKEFPEAARERRIRALIEFSQAQLPIKSTEVDVTMKWEDVLRLSSHGVQIGSHTQNHPILTKISASEVQSELSDSNRAIESVLGRKCPLFAYPNGSWSPEVREIVLQEGHSQAFVNSPGVWTSETDPWLIPRVNIWEGSLIGPSHRFSRVIFEYNTIWRSYQAQRKAKSAKF